MRSRVTVFHQIPPNPPFERGEQDDTSLLRDLSFKAIANKCLIPAQMAYYRPTTI
jgi:hypothetical protein